MALFHSRIGNDSLPVASLAATAGLANLSAFRACLDDPEKEAIVRLDIARGRELGINATPTLHIDDRVGAGGRVAADLAPLIRAARR
jgi:predicted DsbA family dithiol-disulfide isomerase